MDRSDLERLDRESLVTRAQAAGIRRARVLTRPELIDELLRLDPAMDSTQLKKTRGFFGRARDLLSRVVEKGLHLPDAADRLREALGNPLPHVPRPEPQAVPTVTLAEIYAAQGHKQRAMETLKRVLEAEPDHNTARALLEKLQAADYVAPLPPLPPEAEERADEIGANLGTPPSAPALPDVEERIAVAPSPASAEHPRAKRETRPPRSEENEEMRRDHLRAKRGRRPDGVPVPEPVPPTPRLDEPATVPLDDRAQTTATECVAIPIRGDGSYVWWRLSDDARKSIGERSVIVRALVILPTWDVPEHETRDVTVDPDAGEIVLQGLPERAVVRIAVGFIDGSSNGGSSAFVPLAHSPAIEMSPSRGLVCWTLEGSTPIVLEDPRAASIARAAEGAARAASLRG